MATYRVRRKRSTPTQLKKKEKLEQQCKIHMQDTGRLCFANITFILGLAIPILTFWAGVAAGRK